MKSASKLQMNRNREKEIEQILLDVRTMQYLIQNCYSIIVAIDDTRLQRIHAEEVLPLTYDYNNLVKELKNILEQHFKWEKDENYPRNLKLRKLYKQVLIALT